MPRRPYRKKKGKWLPKQPNIRAGGIMFNEDFTEILLIKGRQHQKWGVPKGHLEKHEPELVGGIREILEETGIPILLGSQDVRPPSLRVHKAKLFTFVLQKHKFRLDPEDTNEIVDIAWIRLDELDELESKTRMLEAIIRQIETAKSKAMNMTCLSIANVLIVN